jgi:hypothetical protein
MKNKNVRERAGPRLANLPIIRPFLMGSRRGYKDQPSGMNGDGNVDDERASDCAADIASKQDRQIVVQSISEGIAGVQDDSLALNTDESLQHPNQAPRFLARLFRGPQHQQRNIREFHNLIRKENWSLATAMLRSNPVLPRTWHPVERLYGGRYDGEVLPLHAACALCPPAAFVEELATIYPEALLAKEKSFGRVPLHVACRSLAHSSVIKVLCQMKPECVVEKDGLNRVALHYLIKNYTALGDDVTLCGVVDGSNSEEPSQNDDDNDDDSDSIEILEEHFEPTDEDGLVALRVLIDTNDKCIHTADHRHWIPLHVACSSSSRKGMTNVIKLLLDAWPESVLCKTSKGSDVFDCVEMSGKYHPSKELVLSILKEAKERVQYETSGNKDCSEHTTEDKRENDLDFQNNDEYHKLHGVHTNSEELLIDLDGGSLEESTNPETAQKLDVAEIELLADQSNESVEDALDH